MEKEEMRERGLGGWMKEGVNFELLAFYIQMQNILQNLAWVGSKKQKGS